MSFFVESLHDSHRAAVNRGTEKARHRRIALILNRQSQRRKTLLTITLEARIQIFKSKSLLPAADT